MACSGHQFGLCRWFIHWTIFPPKSAVWFTSSEPNHANTSIQRGIIDVYREVQPVGTGNPQKNSFRPSPKALAVWN